MTGQLRTTKRRWGYLVWGVATLVIAIPELLAAFDKGKNLPFTTISKMTGHVTLSRL